MPVMYLAAIHLQHTLNVFIVCRIHKDIFTFSIIFHTTPSSNGIMDYSYIMFSGHTFPSGVTAMLVRCISTGDTGSCLCCNFAQAASWFYQQVYSVFLTVLLMFPPHWRGGSVINPRHTYCSTSVNKADSQASQHIGLESSWLCTVICVSLNPVFAYYDTLISLWPIPIEPPNNGHSLNLRQSVRSKHGDKIYIIPSA